MSLSSSLLSLSPESLLSLNGAKRALAFTADHVGAFWVHGEHETPAGPHDAWRAS